MRHLVRMTERHKTNETDNGAELLGTREAGACEAASLSALLRRARALGFSDAEIDRLRRTYGTPVRHQAMTDCYIQPGE